MGYGGSDHDGPADVPVTIKILIAGGFGVGKTTLVTSVSEIRPLRTEENLSAPGTHNQQPASPAHLTRPAATASPSSGGETATRRLLRFGAGREPPGNWTTPSRQ